MQSNLKHKIFYFFVFNFICASISHHVFAASCANLALEYANFLKKQAAEARKRPSGYGYGPSADYLTKQAAQAGETLPESADEINTAIRITTNPANKSAGYERLAELSNRNIRGLTGKALYNADPFNSVAQNYRLASETAGAAGDLPRMRALSEKAAIEFVKRGDYKEAFELYKRAGKAKEATEAFKKLSGDPSEIFVGMIESTQSWAENASRYGRPNPEILRRIKEEWTTLKAIADDFKARGKTLTSDSYLAVVRSNAR